MQGCFGYGGQESTPVAFHRGEELSALELLQLVLGPEQGQVHLSGQAGYVRAPDRLLLALLVQQIQAYLQPAIELLHENSDWRVADCLLS